MAAPSGTVPGFYRTAAGAEIDLVLEIPAWAFDIKRGLASRPKKGFYSACEDLKPSRRFLIDPGAERYAARTGLEAVGFREWLRNWRRSGLRTRVAGESLAAAALVFALAPARRHDRPISSCPLLSKA